MVDGVMSAARLPNVQPKMDPLTEKILNLTMEIISLLTGESFPLTKSSNHVTITVPLFHSVKPKRLNMQKILEVTRKMMELLTGEGRLDGDVVESRLSLSLWDPPEEALPSEKSPCCKEESMENENPHNVFHPPIEHASAGGIKEEPEGESLISPNMECPLLSDDGSYLHTFLSLDCTKESTPTEQSPFCKEESLEDANPSNDLLHPPTDLIQHKSEGFKEEPEGGGAISPDLGCRLLSDDGNALHNLSSWDALEAETPNERSPCCKEESMEDGNPPINLHPPADLAPHKTGGIKEDLEGGAITARPLSSADGSPPYMAEDLLHLDMVAGQTLFNEEHLVSDEGIDVPTSRLPTLVPESPLEGEFAKGESLCLKWNVVDPREAQTRKKQSPKLNHQAENGNQFPCPECGRSCRSNADLIQHCRVHTGEKPFQCSECGNRFSKRSSLALHHRIHAGEKPFSCLECGKCFVSKSELTKHSRSHSGLKPYSCTECGKFFTCSSNLFRHKKIHTGEKQFICSECGKSFLTRSQMTIHLRVHTGEKPYPCSECSKCFVSSSDLAKHQRSHTGIKPHICSECGKNYVSRSVLIRHQKIHAAKNRFFCADCGMGFVRRRPFMAHVKANHRRRNSTQTPKLGRKRKNPDPPPKPHS